MLFHGIKNLAADEFIQGLATLPLVVGRLETKAAAGAAVKLTRWGYEGSSKFRAAVATLRQSGDHLDLADIVPTRAEAERLIHAAGGAIERIERAHVVRGHPFPHINYITSAGEKATVQVQSVGRQFIR